MNRLKVGLLGKGGLVGQEYVRLLRNHPYFVLTFAPTRTELAHISQAKGCSLIFSALSMEGAKIYDALYSQAGFPVFSLSSHHRLRDDVPLIIPEVNGEKLKGWEGKVIAKPNCTLQNMILPLYPLHKKFRLKSVAVTNLQSKSGAGSHFTLENNVLPFIEGEEEKAENELLKILEDSSIQVSAHCTRVPVSCGHLSCISASFAVKPTLAEVRACWDQFPGLSLPSSPQQVLVYCEEKERPQPERDTSIGKGMSVALGRLRSCPLFDIRFIALSHNLVRGAAGGGLLTAELYARENLL